MQISMFDGVKPFKITKPIRLIEMFGDYVCDYLGEERIVRVY